MCKKAVLILFCCLLPTVRGLRAGDYRPEFSVAGFYPLENAGREVFHFNAGWRFRAGTIENAERADFDDSAWEVVSTPHTVRLLPAEGSGGRNYQGPAWYRKHFEIDPSLEGKLIHIYFEAAMGRSTVYVNGEKVSEHWGGYLPFSIELTQYGVRAGDRCLLAVMTDNSDDKTYPPGKKQATLDFAYHSGIYRDVWMIATAPIHLTDPNSTHHATGGIHVQFGEISERKAEIRIRTEIENASKTAQRIVVDQRLLDAEGRVIRTVQSAIRLKGGERQSVVQSMTVEHPSLWSPDTPYLYKVATRLSTPERKTALDGGLTRIGLRKIEWKGTDGLWLNNRPMDKLIGGNRHQDYAYVGNAVPNSQHWRDAKKLRDAGCRVIRVAHYPQDPSFMDACDELGMFVIIAIPGWQYWNNDPLFVERVYDDIRNMVRRDRNHPSVLMWEPILNETRWPVEFALEAQRIVREEYPGGACVADNYSDGIAEHYEVVYGWPKDIGRFKQPIFTREFAENVDDWYAQNTNNRASRSWGEHALLLQSLQHAKAYDEMCPASRQFVGGTLWHPFDHQRGYHPDPYWGGIMDAFRQPKYSWYLFKSQIDAGLQHPLAETGPMVFIAHELSPFSAPDVTVFTNCDEVRLIVYERDTLIEKAPKEQGQLPHPPVTFKDVFAFNTMRTLPYTEKNWQQVSLVAEGLMDGQVVCRTKKMPARRSNHLRLRLDNEEQALVADGSDFIPVICEVTDDDGNVRRLAKEQILFSVEGEGEIIGDAHIGANPRAVEFGSAPVLIRSTLTAGKIRLHARVLFEGENVPSPADIEWESIPPPYPPVYSERLQRSQRESASELPSYQPQWSEEEKRRMLNEVERQQTDFGEKK
jgi:beta-galactosidase